MIVELIVPVPAVVPKVKSVLAVQIAFVSAVALTKAPNSK